MSAALDRREILRYLGAAHSDEALDRMIDRAEEQVIAAARPKHVYRHISFDLNGESVGISGTVIHSRDLAQHLRGCREGFLFACTLGQGVDVLVKRVALTDLPMMPVVQAVAAAYTEYCADSAQQELEDYAQRRGLYLRPRYSPGYGDFQLDCQRFLFDALEIPKKIGVTLTDGFIMVPFKSITAVVGLSEDPSLCHINKCMTCTAKNCPFRKEDRNDA